MYHKLQIICPLTVWCYLWFSCGSWEKCERASLRTIFRSSYRNSSSQCFHRETIHCGPWTLWTVLISDYSQKTLNNVTMSNVH